MGTNFRGAVLRVVVAVLAVGGSARADRVGPLVPQVEPSGSVEKEAVDKLHESVVRGLEAGGLTSVKSTDARDSLGKAGLESCGGAACAKKAAQALEVARVVATTIQVTGKNYDIQCQMLSTDGAVLAKAAGSCDICTFAEAQAAVAKTATDLARRAPAAPPAPPVVAAPVPAPRPAAGPAPAPKPLPPPKPEPEPEKPRGPAPRPTPVAKPAPRPAPAPAPTAGVSTEAPTRRPYLWWAVGAWTGGVVALGVGGYLAAIHGDPSCTSNEPGFDAERDCPEVFNTGLVGGMLLGLGAVAITGGFLLYFREEPILQAGVSVVPGGDGGLATGFMRW